MTVSPLAGKPAPPAILVDVPRLVSAYYTTVPDASEASQRVAFGTSGHRGSSFTASFNEWHVLAISEAICRYRKTNGIDGPLFLGADTHALSAPATASALEILSAHGIDVMLAEHDEYTPTPAISHAILTYNRGRTSGLADGIVVTPSHNPPDSGGFKYNPPNGGPADTDITGWIEKTANELLAARLAGIRRISLTAALRATTTHRHDYIRAYVDDLASVIEMDSIADAKLRIGVDALGGAGVAYWPRIAERYGLDLTLLDTVIDPTFRFMAVDWDGKIRMDPSSSYAMANLLRMKDRFDIAFACDTDHDRHGIITPAAGLLPSNHYLAVAVDYLFRNRLQWSPEAAVGKTVVSSQMIDRVTARLERKLYEVPVGFKWFVAGLNDGRLGFGGEESAGAVFLRRDGTVWTTDKDGITPGLLSAEILARTGRDPGEVYRSLEEALGRSVQDRVEAPISAEQKKRLSKISPDKVRCDELAGEPVQTVLTQAPGNGAAIGGLKIIAKNGWFAARPSGTEDIYKIYAESFCGNEHLQRILADAQAIVDATIAEVLGRRTDVLAPSDDALVDRLQRSAFEYFIRWFEPTNGLVADTTRPGSPASIAVVGFALSVYPVGVERGWMTRDAAIERSLVTLRWFWNSLQHDGKEATGCRGFFYHFLDMKSGLRVWNSELSLIDTALFLAGALTAATYFTGSGGEETEIRSVADKLYERVDWRWATRESGTLSHGWKPECGFLHYGWEGYTEGIILYVLAMASNSRPLAIDGYDAWTETYQWENIYGHDVLYAGPLFVHQYSHAWIDFRGIRDRFMREKRSDYYENSRQATYVHREYALRNPNEFDGYGANVWGLSAGDGPGNMTLEIEGRTRRFAGYAARGVPYGPDDGTIAPAAMLASLPFAPEIVLPAMRWLCDTRPELLEAGGLSSGFNPTLRDRSGHEWRSEGNFGLDQGIVVLMIENYRTEMIWKLMRRCPVIKRGLERAGFTGRAP